MSMQRAMNSETAQSAKHQELSINVCNQDFVHSPYEFRFSPPVSPENSNQDISDVATEADTAEEYTVIAADPHAMPCMQQYYSRDYQNTPQQFPMNNSYRPHLHLLPDQCDRMYDYSYSQLPPVHEYNDYSDYSPQYSVDANSPSVPTDIRYHRPGNDFEVTQDMFAHQNVNMHELEYPHQMQQQPQSENIPSQTESYDLSIALANMPTRILKRKRKVHRGGSSSFFLDELPQQSSASNSGSLSAIMATSAAAPKFVRSR